MARTFKKFKNVNLEPACYEILVGLQKDIKKTTGLRPNLGQIVERALQCLADAQRGEAWLSPKEAAPRFEERHQREVTSILAQFIARALPEQSLQGIDFDRAKNTVTVTLSDGQALPLFAVKETVTESSGAGSGERS